MAESAYFDIDLILAEAEPVKVEILIDCYNMDSLDTGAIRMCPESDLVLLPEDEGPTRVEEALADMRAIAGVEDKPIGKRCVTTKLNDLARGSKPNLPLWLASELQQCKILRIEPSPWYGEAFKKIILADPEVIDLPVKSKYFYEFGMLLAKKAIMNTDQFSFVADVFFERMKVLINLILHLKENDDHVFLHKLTESERECFHKGRDSVYRFSGILNPKRLQSKHRNVLHARKQLKIS